MKLTYILLVALLITYASAQSRFGERFGKNRCTWGPSYWCQHLDAAKECKSVEYCSTQWKNMKVEKISATKGNCAMSAFIVREIRHLLQWRVDQDHLLQLSSSRCDMNAKFHSASVAKCLEINKRHLSDIVNLLKHDVAPEVIVKLLDLCSPKDNQEHDQPQPLSMLSTAPESFIVMPKLQESKAPKEDACEYCVSLVQQMQIYFNQSTSEADFIAMLHNDVCAKIPENQNECNMLVSLYGARLYEALRGGLNATEICKAIQICVSTSAQENRRSTPLNLNRQRLHRTKMGASEIECQVCQYVINSLYNYLQNNRSLAAIEAALENICGLLPASLKNQCDALIVQYAPILVHLISEDLPAKQVCQGISLCSAGAKKVSPPQKAPVLQKAIKSQKGADNIECQLCTYLISSVYNYLQNNRSEAAIEAALDTICGILPASLKDQCDAVINQYAPLLIQLISQDLPPKQVCQSISLCTAGAKKVSPPQKTIKADNIECQLCTYLISSVYNYIQSNRSEAAIEAALDTICGILPASLKDQCDAVINQYAPLLIQLISQDLPPKQVCQSISLCTAGAKKVSLPQKAPVLEKAIKAPLGADSLECQVCQYVISSLYSYLQGNRSEAAIEAALENICGILPASLKGQCDTLISEYAPLLIQLISQDLPPKQVCASISLCPAGAKMILRTQKVQVPKSVHKVSGASSIDSNNICNLGPHVWCLSKAKAIKCGASAVKVCREFYWL